MNAQQQAALDDITSLLETHSELQLNNGDASEFGGATNNIYSGQYNDQSIVFKHFKNLSRKKHEETVLKLFDKTGYVPHIYDIQSDNILVMQRFNGLPFYKAEETISFEQWQNLFRQLGKALAKMVNAAPGHHKVDTGLQDIAPEPDPDYHFYCCTPLETFFDAVTERSHHALKEKDVPHSIILERSLLNICTHRAKILSFIPFIYIDDFHYANIIADGPNLQGFIDFEMTRFGNEAFVLANVLASMIPKQPDRWIWLREGYEAEQEHALDKDLISLAVILAPFSQWIRFMMYWSIDEEPEWAKKKNVKLRVAEGIKKTIELMDTIFPDNAFK